MNTDVQTTADQPVPEPAPHRVWISYVGNGRSKDGHSLGPRYRGHCVCSWTSAYLDREHAQILAYQHWTENR